MSNKIFFKKIGYCFNDLKLFEEAITHRSYLQDIEKKGVAFNERMEFLGDAILDSIISELLYINLPEADEGRLTSLRTQIVRGRTLAKIAGRIQLGEMLRLGYGEESQGGRKKASILADALEALIAAVFLDSDYDRTKKFVSDIFEETIKEKIVMKKDDNYKSELQEILQENGPVEIAYIPVKTEGHGHARKFFVRVEVDGESFGEGEGSSKKEAEQKAAKEAIENIDRNKE